MRKRFVRRCCLLYATTKKYPHPQKRKRPFPHLVYYGHVPTIDNYPFSSVYLVAREKKQPGLSSYQAIIVIMTCVLTRRSITRKNLNKLVIFFLVTNEQTHVTSFFLSLSDRHTRRTLSHSHASLTLPIWFYCMHQKTTN